MPAEIGAEEEEESVKVETPEQLYWATLKVNPGDFDTWVKLLQLVEQQVSLACCHLVERTDSSGRRTQSKLNILYIPRA